MRLVQVESVAPSVQNGIFFGHFYEWQLTSTTLLLTSTTQPNCPFFFQKRIVTHYSPVHSWKGCVLPITHYLE